MIPIGISTLFRRQWQIALVKTGMVDGLPVSYVHESKGGQARCRVLGGPRATLLAKSSLYWTQIAIPWTRGRSGIYSVR